MTTDKTPGIFTQVPATFTTTLRIKNKKRLRKMIPWLCPSLTRPVHVSPRKKVAWRLTRKWFNRYEKPELLKENISSVLTPERN